MTAVIFLGPTLALEEARSIFPEAIYRPPIAMGDLASIVRNGVAKRPWGIGIVDGVFYQALPVWHKEILYALENGIAVFGSSSMGALRAAECATFGMVGIGEVYRRFACGELVDDDEVALAHAGADDGWRGHSQPLVNIRVTMETAYQSEQISKEIADDIIAAAKSLWFPERTIAKILDIAASGGMDDESLTLAQGVLEESYIDIKRSDAIELLVTMRQLGMGLQSPDVHPADATHILSHAGTGVKISDEGEPADPAKKALKVTRTLMFDAMLERDRCVMRGGTQITQEEIARFVALSHPGFPALRDRVLDRFLAQKLVELWKVEATPNDVNRERHRFCKRHQFGDDQELAAWCAENDLSSQDFENLMAEEARLRKARGWAYMFLSKRLLVETLLTELKLQGEYGEWANCTAILHRSVPVDWQGLSDATDTSNEQDIILDQMRAGGWRPDVPINEFASEAGFQDVYDLLDELRRHSELRRIRRKALGILEGFDREAPAKDS